MLEVNQLNFEGMNTEVDTGEQRDYLLMMEEQPDLIVHTANPIKNTQPESIGSMTVTKLKHTQLSTHQMQDQLLEGPAPLPPPTAVPQPEPQEFRQAYIQLSNRVQLCLVDTVCTLSNSFGLSHIYYGRPTRIPDENLGIEELSGNLATEQSMDSEDHHGPFSVSQTINDAIYPYPNLSSWQLGSWFWTQGETKSKAGLKSLINDVILADDFNKEELRAEGWQESSVEILVPTRVKTTKKAKKKMKANMHILKASTLESGNPPAGQRINVEGVFH
ncbi:hypothetical protein M422DRAFT_245532 [Sphaerobolus stellatus SS14]|nr:hypothetical protein M422DRAFT_245532 [Sphaerobolus stellatus SS14]